MIPTFTDILNRQSYWVVYVWTGRYDEYTARRILQAFHVPA